MNRDEESYHNEVIRILGENRRRIVALELSNKKLTDCLREIEKACWDDDTFGFPKDVARAINATMKNPPRSHETE